MVFVSIADKKKTDQLEKNIEQNQNEPFLIGDTLYPPAVRNEPEYAIQAVKEKLKYKPLEQRRELLVHYLIDSFIPQDNPEELFRFINKLKDTRPELAVRLFEHCLPQRQTNQNTSTTNVQINGPAPVVLTRQVTRTVTPETDIIDQTDP